MATNYTHNTSAGTNAYTWDRANRLLSMGGISYEYDGMGNRVSQTANSIVTQYLLDVQPGLVKVLAETTSGATTRYIHGPRGLERQQQASGSWVFPVQDGLGSVRGEVSVDWPDLDVDGTKMYAPYGVPFGAEGAMGSAFGFTGEMTDENDLVFLRARYLNPGLGVFVSRDPIVATNAYSYASSNPIRHTDANGMLPCDTATGQDLECLNRIQGKLQTLANNGELLGIIAPGSGGTALSLVMWHYLGASGNTRYISHDWMDPEFHRQVASKIEEVFQNTSYFQNLCNNGCCDSSSDIDIGSLINNYSVRGLRSLVVSPNQDIDQAPWYTSLLGPIKDKLIEQGLAHKDQQGNENVINPYYGAYGGVTANSAGQTRVRATMSSGLNAEIELITPVEYYDYYDWFFGGCGAGGKATGTHPQNMRVGHFLALEKAGRAKPFNWYSYADIIIKYTVICTGSQATLTNKIVEVRQGQQLEKPIQAPCNMPTEWNSPNFIDNWTPELTEALKAKGYDDELFPTEEEMDAEGNIF